LILIEKTLLKKIFMLLCILSLLMPLTTAQNGDSANSLEIASVITTQTGFNGGLMDSAWPMFGHDCKHTGRSPYGPVGNWPIIKWKFQMEGQTDSSPAIDENGTVYIGSDGFHDKLFFAINPNGTEKWSFNPGDWVKSSPALSSNGIIYFGTLSGDLYALYPNGTSKWSTHLGAGWVYSSPAIGNDGTIYAASVNSNRLCAVNPNGTIKWYFYAELLIYCSPAIADDGTIYVGSNDGYMYAVYPNGTMKWKFYAGGPKGIGSAPSIADDGTIYFGGTSGYLYALYPNGTLQWKIGTGYIGESSPAINSDGTLYVGDQDNHRIYSINPNGSVNWYYTTGGEIISSPALDKYGIIYCGSYDGYLYALNPDGTLRWKFNAGDSIESSVAIGEDGTIYIAAQFEPSGGNNSYTYLYALDFIDNSSPSTPSIDGPATGTIEQNYNYTIVSTDPEGNNISYYVNWGDGTNTGWIGPYISSQEQTVSHTWAKKGTYTIQVKAKDNYSAESDWGILQVTMPTSYNIPFIQFLLRLLNRFPNAFPIMRYFFENHNIK
jgi:outer membrane protein assembly factor BamB